LKTKPELNHVAAELLGYVDGLQVDAVSFCRVLEEWRGSFFFLKKLFIVESHLNLDTNDGLSLGLSLLFSIYSELRAI
jgi:hypothetical protein